MSVELAIFNIPPKVTPEQLHDLFATYGQIEQTAIADKGGRKQGCVRMADEQEAYAAMLALDRHQIEGHVIRVGQDSDEAKLYLSHLPSGMTVEQIEAVLGPIMFIETLNKHAANVYVQTVGAAIEAIQGNVEINGKPIGVGPLVPRKDAVLSEEEEQVALSIIQELQETAEIPLRQIREIVRLCGPLFAQVVLEQTRQVEEAGGLIIPSLGRRRTVGGVFFYLARERMSRRTRRLVFPEQFVINVEAKAEAKRKAKALKQEKAAAQAKQAKAKAKGQAKGAPPKQQNQQQRPPQAKGQPPKRPPTNVEKPPTSVPVIRPVPPLGASNGSPAERLAELREAEGIARGNVTAIRSSPGQVGLARAMNELQVIKNQIADLLKANPDLG